MKGGIGQLYMNFQLYYHNFKSEIRIRIKKIIFIKMNGKN